MERIRRSAITMKVIFVGQNGYGYPHTRVRCYNFAKAVHEAHPDIETDVLSFRDHLCPERTEDAMYGELRDGDKRHLIKLAIQRLTPESESLMVVQKAHFHAAAPYHLHRKGMLAQGYLYDCDDYDVPLPNVFGRSFWNWWYFGGKNPAEITEIIAREAKGCVASSRWLVDWLLQYNPQVAYIPTGVDTERFQPPQERDPHRKITFLWNGLVWGQPIYENVSMAIRCFARACETLRNAELYIVGEGLLWDRVLTDISQDVEVPIRYKWAVRPDKMPAVLHEADVGLLPVVPSKNSELNQWSAAKSPTKLFEYLACGLPVIATKTGEAVHVITDGQEGFLVEDEEAFVASIIQLGQDADLRQRMGAAARRTVEERFALNALGKSLGEYIKKINGQ